MAIFCYQEKISLHAYTTGGSSTKSRECYGCGSSIPANEKLVVVRDPNNCLLFYVCKECRSSGVKITPPLELVDEKQTKNENVVNGWYNGKEAK
jgi:predicted RNA-binding Zn-ribbon protein involved in translation (DUF1610 family)